jgi:hypothetical protein
MIKRHILNKKEKKTSNQYYLILVGLIILFVVYRSFFKIETIGSDFRYLLIVFLIPTGFGIVILGFIKKNYLKYKLKDAKGLLQKGFLILLYIIQGFLFSYLSVGLFANVIWDNLNKKSADVSPTEIIECKITNFNSGTSKSSPNIYFLLHDKYERLSIDHETYGKYYNKELTDLSLQIKVRKGIWSYYILDEWKIINNR